MLTLGHRGPVLLEDANDLALIAEWGGKIPPRKRWIDELRLEAEHEALMRL